VRDAVFGAYGKNEMLYAKSLLDQVPDRSLTVFDKGFFSASLLLQLHRKGAQRHWLIPAKANSTWERLDSNPGDYRVRMKVSAQARQAEPELPGFWEARAIETTTRHGKKRILSTSLMDTKAYPANEIVLQYEERWRIETSYRELKQDLLGSELTLRSGTPETVYQEVWGRSAGLQSGAVGNGRSRCRSRSQADRTQLHRSLALFTSRMGMDGHRIPRQNSRSPHQIEAQIGRLAHHNKTGACLPPCR
jgi:hypothetical protein